MLVAFLFFFLVQSMHAKQKSLLERVDALDEDCEELQRQLGESEESQVILHNQLQQMREEKEQQQAQLVQEQVNRKPSAHEYTLKLLLMLLCFPPTGLAFRAPKREADSRNTHRRTKEQCGRTKGKRESFKGEREAAGGFPRAQPTGSGPTTE